MPIIPDMTTAAGFAPDAPAPESLLILPSHDSPHSPDVFKNCAEGGWYSLFRKGCGPTLYSSNKTPVTADVLEAGLLFATGIIFVGLVCLALGVRGSKNKWFFPLRSFLALFILASILLCNFGQEWEVSELYTKTPYRAGINEEIHAHVGVKIGLRSVNITLRADPEVVSFKHGLHEERINYNERYSWDSLGFAQGRNGFGRYSGLINREFRESQFRGTPLPILWIAEYFTLDGEGIRFGRHYRMAGWYAHIMMWAAFPLWVLSMVLFYMVISYGAMCSIFTGFVLGSANLMFIYIRNPLDIDGVIPFEDGKMHFHYGWCFWLNAVTACLCTVLGVVFLLLDCFNVEAVAAFLAKDIQQEFEDVYIEVPTVPSQEESSKEDTVDVIRSLSCISAISSASQLEKYMVLHYQRRRGTNGSIIGKLAKYGRRPTLVRIPWSRNDDPNALTPEESTPLPHPGFQSPKVKVTKESEVTKGSPAVMKQVSWSERFTGVYDNVDLSAEYRERLMKQRNSAIYEEQELTTIRDVAVEIDSSSSETSLNDGDIQDGDIEDGQIQDGGTSLMSSPTNSLPNSLPHSPTITTPQTPPPHTAHILDLPLFNARPGSSSSLLSALTANQKPEEKLTNQNPEEKVATANGKPEEQIVTANGKPGDKITTQNGRQNMGFLTEAKTNTPLLSNGHTSSLRHPKPPTVSKSSTSSVASSAPDLTQTVSGDYDNVFVQKM